MPDVSSVCDKITEILSYDPLHPILFSSGLFLFLFAGFAFFYQFMRRAVMLRMIYVVLFSLYFYYKTSGLFLFLLVGMSVSDYVIGRFLCAARKQSLRKWLVALSLTIDIGVLCYFKYTNFFIGLLNDVSGRDWLDFQNIFLPVGISFFTFQSISYIIDLYKRRIDPADQWIDYLFYLSFFPQLVAGPIVKARDFMPQIRQKPIVVTREMFGMGIFLIISGLFKKAIISDYISLNFVDRIFDNPLLYSGFENLMGVYGYALQIYCDFSGYSDMAIGIALLLGFRFPKNFDAPYHSATITEFWRRWHISLSSWLKDYLYISLGGNRKGLKRQIFNLFVVELLTGIWHGADWNFICWGLYYFVLLAIEKLFLLKYLEKGKFWPHVYTLFLVVVGWAMFVGNDYGVGFGELFHRLFVPTGGVSPVYFLRNYGVLLAVSAVCCTPLIETLWNALKKRTATRVATVLVLLVLSTAYVVGSTNSPFLYFNF